MVDVDVELDAAAAGGDVPPFPSAAGLSKLSCQAAGLSDAPGLGLVDMWRAVQGSRPLCRVSTNPRELQEGENSRCTNRLRLLLRLARSASSANRPDQSAELRERLLRGWRTYIRPENSPQLVTRPAEGLYR